MPRTDVLHQPDQSSHRGIIPQHYCSFIGCRGGGLIHASSPEQQNSDLLRLSSPCSGGGLIMLFTRAPEHRSFHKLDFLHPALEVDFSKISSPATQSTGLVHQLVFTLFWAMDLGNISSPATQSTGLVHQLVFTLFWAMDLGNISSPTTHRTGLFH